MAKERGISGWHSMRKEQLVKALIKTAGNGKATNGKAKSRTAAKKNGTGTKPSVLRKIRALQEERERQKDLATGDVQVGPDGQKRTVSDDRIVLMVRDAYWLHAYWELTATSVSRAKVALAERWHAARPVLRVVSVSEGSLDTISDEVIRVIDIHGEVCNWYIDVKDPPNSYRVDVGYMTSDGHFHALARSNVVTTPVPGNTEMIDGNWQDVVENSEKIYAMSGGFDSKSGNEDLQDLFEERLRRPMGSPMRTRFGNGAEAAVVTELRKMNFTIDAEVIVFGRTDPSMFVTMGGDPIKLAPDGSFTARMGFPDKRQVIPFVASRSDGVQEQTIVLAIERNTKVMEPVVREIGD